MYGVVLCVMCALCCAILCRVWFCPSTGCMPHHGIHLNPVTPSPMYSSGITALCTGLQTNVLYTLYTPHLHTCPRLSMLDLVSEGSSWEEVVDLAVRIEAAGATIINTGIGKWGGGRGGGTNSYASWRGGAAHSLLLCPVPV